MRLLAPRSGARCLSGHLPRGTAPGRSARSVRLRVPAGNIGFHDAFQGLMTQSMEKEVGDFVVFRADRVVAYHLAVVVDDAEQGITEVVRGCDLLESTPRQILVQRALGLPTPEYAHLPIAVDANERKLSKQNLARPVAADPPGAVLVDALEFLGQGPPRDLARAPPPRSSPGRSPAGTVHGSRAGALRRRPATPTTRGSAHASSKPLPIRCGQGHAPRRTGSPTDG